MSGARALRATAAALLVLDAQPGDEEVALGVDVRLGVEGPPVAGAGVARRRRRVRHPLPRAVLLRAARGRSDEARGCDRHAAQLPDAATAAELEVEVVAVAEAALRDASGGRGPELVRAEEERQVVVRLPAHSTWIM